MYVILEFLETCDEVHKKMALSCLSYLIENPKVIQLKKYFVNFLCESE